MTMGRYRFVEGGLAPGKRETEQGVVQTRQNLKLWNRLDEQDAAKDGRTESLQQYHYVLRNKNVILLDVLADMLDNKDNDRRMECQYCSTYGTAEA